MCVTSCVCVWSWSGRSVVDVLAGHGSAVGAASRLAGVQRLGRVLDAGGRAAEALLKKRQLQEFLSTAQPPWRRPKVCNAVPQHTQENPTDYIRAAAPRNP